MWNRRFLICFLLSNITQKLLLGTNFHPVRIHFLRSRLCGSALESSSSSISQGAEGKEQRIKCLKKNSINYTFVALVIVWIEHQRTTGKDLKTYCDHSVFAIIQILLIYRGKMFLVILASTKKLYILKVAINIRSPAEEETSSYIFQRIILICYFLLWRFWGWNVGEECEIWRTFVFSSRNDNEAMMEVLMLSVWQKAAPVLFGASSFPGKVAACLAQDYLDLFSRTECATKCNQGLWEGNQELLETRASLTTAKDLVRADGRTQGDPRLHTHTHTPSQKRDSIKLDKGFPPWWFDLI